MTYHLEAQTDTWQKFSSILSRMAFHLASILTCFLTSILAFCLAPVQPFIPAFYLASILTFDLAFLTYVLTFHLAVFTFYLAYILTSCLTFYLAFSLAFALAFAWIQACLYNYASPLSDCRKVPLLVLRCSGAASRNIAPEQYAPSPAPAATPPCCSSQTLPPAPNLVVISIIMLWLGTGGLPHFRGRASALQSK